MTATGNFIFICPACGYKARLPDQFSGRTIKCPGCQVPQVATAPLNTEHKTASFIRVAATPVPFTMPQEQIDALAGAQSTPAVTAAADMPSVVPQVAPQVAPKAFPSPLPGAIQITTDRVTNQTSTVATPTGRVAKVAQGGTVDFTCNSCNARLRLPGHYAGKSILCPKCSTPQKVLVANSTEPMDTTRSIALKEEASTTSPRQTPVGTGTGIRVRVTPLPSTYPTPLPTAITTPATNRVEALKPTGHPAPAAPIATLADAPVLPESTPLMGNLPPSPTTAPLAKVATEVKTERGAGSEDELTNDIDTISTTALADEAPSKPHPSKGKIKTEAIRRPATSASPSAPVTPAKSPIGLIALAGGLLVLAILFGSGLAYYALALGETRTRLDEAQRAAKDAAEREHTATKKASELDSRIAELEAALKAASEMAKPTTPPAAEAPAVAPVDPVPAPTPAPVEEPPK